MLHKRASTDSLIRTGRLPSDMADIHMTRSSLRSCVESICIWLCSLSALRFGLMSRRAATHEHGHGHTGSSSVLRGTSPPLPPKDAKSGEELDGPGGAAADGM